MELLRGNKRIIAEIFKPYIIEWLINTLGSLRKCINHLTGVPCLVMRYFRSSGGENEIESEGAKLEMSNQYRRRYTVELSEVPQ